MLTKERLIDEAHAAIEKSDVKDKPTKATVKRVIDAAFDLIAGSLERGVPAFLPDVGRLSVKTRKATKGRNPQTKEVIEIPSKRVVRLSVGSELKGRLNKAKVTA